MQHWSSSGTKPNWRECWRNRAKLRSKRACAERCETWHKYYKVAGVPNFCENPLPCCQTDSQSFSDVFFFFYFSLTTVMKWTIVNLFYFGIVQQPGVSYFRGHQRELGNRAWEREEGLRRGWFHNAVWWDLYRSVATQFWPEKVHSEKCLLSWFLYV